mgnify:CR=1 FL=1
MSSLYALGIGIGSKNSRGEWLEVLFPVPRMQVSAELTAQLQALCGSESVLEPSEQQLQQLAAATAGIDDELAALCRRLTDSRSAVVIVALQSDQPPTDVPTAYLKLQLLSHRLVKPHQTDLSGIFATLKNLAWTNQGAIDLDELADRQLQARLAGKTLSVDCVDKFPKMVDYVVPSGVRIADTARVRLGAYVGEGTTVMHEGFINFNAGAEGPNMVEGRISAGVFVGAGSDIGGGASTMGTLSGGGNIIISLGEQCLLGANAGVGIPLGDRCTVEAGLYITAGTQIQLLDENRQPVKRVKARDLAGASDLLFRRNSNNGAVECLTNKSAVQLNEALHVSN